MGETMETTTLLGLAVVSMIGIATPGPDLMLAASNSSRYGVCDQ
jgi:threonine/homoserine/homoserine lactone efflux protein